MGNENCANNNGYPENQSGYSNAYPRYPAAPVYYPTYPGSPYYNVAYRSYSILFFFNNF